MEKLGKIIKSKELNTEEKEGNDESIATEEKIRTMGPWGGSRGDAFDDGTFSGIREIKIGYNRWIHSIDVVYDKDGKPTEHYVHGGVVDQPARSQVKFAQINLEDSEEFITKVSGNYGPADDPEGEPIFHFVGSDSWVRSLTFASNKRTYGPYGVERGRSFNFTTNGDKIVGLLGRSGWYMDAIGFHLSGQVAPSTNRFGNCWAKVRSICIPSKGRRRQEPKVPSQSEETPKKMEPKVQGPGEEPPEKMEPSSKHA